MAIINAARAREKTNEVLKRSMPYENMQLMEIDTLIEKAVSEGKYSIVYDKLIVSTVLRTLFVLGYTVEGGDYRGKESVISW